MINCDTENDENSDEENGEEYIYSDDIFYGILLLHTNINKQILFLCNQLYIEKYND